MASTTSDRSTADRSAASDRHAGTATTDRSGGADGRLRIDGSVFAAMADVPAPVTVAEFVRWFDCFATAGRTE